ncbi:myb-binding protein 1A [Lepeophtheirus salmonis]|uniref:myb-binding protein 1A n=1 Tax=Lepeophtheirus salmonis TaxID=72036 RepID=UPI001AE9C1E7|nr:rDNA transcriptional regulator pol5-like [Lepeophtheirus salmonis]
MQKGSTEGLDLFWKLGDVKNDKTRLEVVQRLLAKVNSDRDDKLDMDYVLTRLIRGMASSRSRQGFFLTLTELIRRSGPSSYSKVMKLKEEHLMAKGTKSEEGENACGHLFVLGALLRSGVEFSLEEKTSIVNEIFEVSGKRSYIAGSAMAILKDFIERSEKSEDKNVMMNAYKAKYKNGADISSLNQAWIVVVLLIKWPKFFAKENATKITDSVLVDQFGKHMKECNVPLASLKIHPGLKEIIRFLCEKEIVHSFWTQHVGPFISKESTYRTSVAFIMLSYVMLYLSSNDRNTNISSFISSNFVGASLSYLSRRNESSDEDKIILGIYENIIKVAEEAPETQVPLLKVLLTGTGTVTFDKVTGGSLIVRLSAVCSPMSIKSLGEIYKTAAEGGKKKNQQLTFHERLFAIQQFAKLTSHSSLTGEVEWKIESLQFLLSNVIFQNKKTTPWNSATRIQAKNAFFKGLDIKEKSFGNTCKVLKETLLFANNKLGPKSDALSSENKKVWMKMTAVVKSISYESDKKLSVFLILFAHMGFQLFHQPEMAVEALKDLHICYEKACGEIKTSVKVSLGDEENDEPIWTEVIVDLLLSLLSQNRSILRQVVNTVFSLISPFVTTKALQTIIDVINPSIEKEEEDEDEMDMDDEDVDVCDETDNDEEEESESEEEDNEMQQNDVNEEIRKDIKSALGDGAVQSDTGSVDVDDMDEESMAKIDEALANVFKILCKKKSQNQKKKEKKDAIAQIHFKIRALDMIDMYLSRPSNPPPTSHVIYLISPLLSALEYSLKISAINSEKGSIVSSIKSVLKKISNIKRPDIDSELDPESLIGVIKMFIGLANRGSPLVQQLNHPVPIFSKLCCFILKAIELSNNESVQKKVIGVYEKSLNDYFCRSHCLLPCNFFSIPFLNNRNGMWSLSSKILLHTFDDKIRQFRRIQGFNLIITYVKSATPEHKSDRDELVKSCVKKIIQIYQGESISDVISKFICQSLSILKDFNSSKPIREIVNWDEVKTALVQLRSKIPGFKSFTDLRKSFNKIAVPLNINPLLPSEKAAVQTFEDSDDAMDVDSEETKSKASKKKSKKRKTKVKKDTIASRKAKKMFELDGQFKGEALPSFKGITRKDKSKFVYNGDIGVA